jgi:hypothetical protein
MLKYSKNFRPVKHGDQVLIFGRAACGKPRGRTFLGGRSVIIAEAKGV